ncbi:hypothetical protein ACSQ67_009403 [Phaseolus vulgaris]
MATNNKWLNIVVDGNSALAPYWPSIFSDCLQNIVRTFFEESRNEGANAQVGLILYNANDNPGLGVQYIYWTKEVDDFLAVLPSLVFTGNNENQHTIVQGLSEALVMFPRPSNVMTAEEYYHGTRHCIVIAARDPVPLRMPVSVPEISRGKIIGTQLYTANADFYDVAELFGPLAVSLSIISPVHHPCFEVIFNMGSIGTEQENSPISNIRIGHFNVLLSRNFREAHVALRGKRAMDPPTNDIRVPLHHNQGGINPGSLVAPNVSTRAGFSTPPMAVSNAPTSTTREGFSQGFVEEGRGMAMVAGSSAMGVGMADPRGFPPAHNSTTPFPSSENSFNILPYLASMLPDGASICCPRLPFLAAGFDPYGRPIYEPNGVAIAPVTPQFNPFEFWPPKSSVLNLVQVWQGSLVAETNRSRKSNHRGKAHVRATSPSTLTMEWSSRLETAFYLPQKALEYTITIFHGPIEYVFFYMLNFNNLDFFEHLTKQNLCARVTLPTQILIISPTENQHYYVGTVFPRVSVM